MFPIGLSLGISPELLLTCTIITNALLFLPSYPISIAAANTDTTGSIKMGKYVFDHSFMKPCLISMIIGTGISYLLMYAKSERGYWSQRSMRVLVFIITNFL